MKRALAQVGLLCLFVTGALAQARWVNLDASTHDQSAYLAQARLLAETHFEAQTNRIEMPALPSLLALFYRQGLDDAAWFWRGKLVCIALAALVAIAMTLTLRRVLRRQTADYASLVLVFFVFMFRAAYVQTEPLYYLLALWATLALDATWRAPTVWRAVLAGAILGAAWLTKASILVVGMAALGLYLVREIADLARKRQWTTLAARFGAAAAGALAFAAVVAPYARTSKRLQGQWLYNLSPRYVMWCDSWEDFIDHMRRLGPVEGWRALPDQSGVPSMAHYLESHSLAHIAWRTASGLVLVVGNLIASPFGLPLAATLLLMGGLWASKRRRLPSLLDRSSSGWFPIYLAAHALLQGFYAPIAAGARFSIAIALPAFVLALRAAESLGEEPTRLFGREVSFGLGLRGLERATWALLLSAVPVATATLYCGG